MMHVDPASEDFVKLPWQERAGILRHQYNWSTRALADEFGVAKSTVLYWTTPGGKERKLASDYAYRKTDKGRVMRRDTIRRYRAKKKAMQGLVFVDPSHAAFQNLTREHQARIYLCMGLDKKAIASKLKADPNTVRYWIDPVWREAKKADSLRRHHARSQQRGEA